MKVMKALLYVVFLLLSLPNLLAGLAFLVLKHTFSTRDFFQIINDFLFEIVWGLPLAAGLLLVLLVLGIPAKTRPYAALFCFVLNTTALVFVLSRLGVPHVLDETIFYLPVSLALIGFAWLACPCFRPRGSEGF